jgi:small-conductance mechanosensitive channel
MGGVYKTSARPFEVGDRISVSNHRGDVLDQTVLSTRLFEVGPGEQIHQYTGRIITVPNSLFLTYPVVNESHEKYLLHTFTIPVLMTEEWSEFRDCLLKTAEEHCASYMPDARRHMERLARKEGIDVPSVEPRVTVHLAAADRLNFIVRIPAPGLKKGRIEQNIVSDFLHKMGKKLAVKVTASKENSKDLS